eukprot:5362398-Prymnesium_polylepis.1
MPLNSIPSPPIGQNLATAGRTLARAAALAHCACTPREPVVFFDVGNGGGGVGGTRKELKDGSAEPKVTQAKWLALGER